MPQINFQRTKNKLSPSEIRPTAKTEETKPLHAPKNANFVIEATSKPSTNARVKAIIAFNIAT